MKVPYLWFLSLICFTGCSDINKQLGLADDNMAEELAEAAFKIETGVDIDFTPNSPEK